MGAHDMGEQGFRQAVIFGGTTEGREIAEYCSRKGYAAVYSAATEYGEAVLPALPGVTVRTGRLSETGMRELLESLPGETLVLDATHPYASEVSRCIRSAAKGAGIRMMRVTRAPGAGQNAVHTAEPAPLTEPAPVEEQTAAGKAGAALEAGQESVIFADSAAEAAALLRGTEERVLLVTGSKELPEFAGIPRERLFVRVLPNQEALRCCSEAGILPAHVAAMQGPFSEEMNLALLRQFGCTVLVTKESGAAGGYREKLSACEKAGARAVVIRRPAEQAGEAGVSVPEALEALDRFFQIGEWADQLPTVLICGVGPGSLSLLTGEVREAVLQADVLVGAERMTALGQRLRECGGRPAAESRVSIRSREMAEQAASAASKGKRAAVLVSGDSGFYSAAAGVVQVLKELGIPFRLMPGISSLSLLSARAGLPWQGVPVLSLHGRRADWMTVLRRAGVVFLTLSRGRDLPEIAERLRSSGAGDCRMHCGADLSLPEELYVSTRAEDFGRPGTGTEEDCKRLLERTLVCVMLVSPAGAASPLHPGIPDECFQRVKGVPLTKSEIRAQLMALLKPKQDAVCWDVGCGSGGVTAELAFACPEGAVYALDCDPEAVRLTADNARHFGLSGVTVKEAAAPEGLAELPAPDCVFVGGSGGRLREILSCVFEKNPAAVTAVTAVTLETAAELFSLLNYYENLGFETDCLQVSAARSQKLGGYHLMQARNPVWIGLIRGIPAAGRAGQA